MQRLLLVRHGSAEPDAGGGDEHRPLTQEGAAVIAAMADGFAAHVGGKVSLAISPLVRAQQTASLLAAKLRLTSSTTLPQLQPEASERDALAALLPLGDVVVAVSHMPLLPRLVLALSGTTVSFATGTVVELVRDAGAKTFHVVARLTSEQLASRA